MLAKMTTSHPIARAGLILLALLAIALLAAGANLVWADGSDRPLGTISAPGGGNVVPVDPGTLPPLPGTLEFCDGVVEVSASAAGPVEVCTSAQPGVGQGAMQFRSYNPVTGNWDPVPTQRRTVNGQTIYCATVFPAGGTVTLGAVSPQCG
jgi:hypothetical protein